MGRKYNNSKSALVLQNYKPEDIQKLLDSGEFKSVIVSTLGVNMKTFNEYMRQYNLTYKPPIKLKINNSNGNRRIIVNNDDDTFEKFKLKQIELRYKNQLKHINDIKQNGYIGCVGLAGKY